MRTKEEERKRDRDYKRNKYASDPNFKETIRQRNKKNYLNNREENLARSAQWRKNHPGYMVASALKSRYKRVYGLNPEDYDQMFADQNGKCAICDRQSNSDGGKLRLDIDHNHITGKVRGLLCGMCNRGIGQLGDDPARVERAAQYLRLTQANIYA